MSILVQEAKTKIKMARNWFDIDTTIRSDKGLTLETSAF